MLHHSYVFSGIFLVLSACASGERTSTSAASIPPASSGSAVDAQGRSVREAVAVHPQPPAPPTVVTIEQHDRTRSGAAADSANWPPRLTPEPADIAKVAVSKLTPAARSPAFAPPKWDAAAYRRDPQAYLDETLPGRVNQTAQPAADVQFLTADGPAGFQVAPLARVTLAVRGDPWMPVTFTSFGLGAFVRTGQVSVTVPADGEGRAFAAWVATTGTVGSVLILGASPTRAGQVQFLIQVTE